MNIWEKAPFVRLLPPLLVGILFAAKQTYPHPVLLLWLAGNTLICFNLATKIWVCGYAWRWIPGLCMNVLIFSTGLLLYRQHQIELKPDWLGHHLYQAKYLTGTPENIAVPGSKSARIVLIVTSTIDSNGSKKRVAGKVILY